ncbi:MAG: hypothetical protein N3B21_05150 [Clostridia bacterium]|nr:hypothetical protein [Clostridia bacterium]
MELLKKVFDGWKLIASKVVKEISGSDILLLLLLMLIAAMVLALVITTIKYRNRKRRFTILKDRKNVLWKLTNQLKGHELSMKVLDNLAIKLGMYNKYSYERNLEYAAIVCIITVIFTAISTLVFLPSAKVAWYVTLSYIFITLVFVAIVFVIFTFMARMRLTSKLPDTYKLLNSRYITTGNILKAINVSLDDFDKAVKREMIKIYDVLKKNDMYEIEEAFKRLEKTYKNEYITLLLNLIMQAHYKGGDEVIKKQFENTTEEILEDIENQRDLSFTSRLYMFLALVLPFSIWGLEKFNEAALDNKAIEFYSSPFGIELKILFFFAFLVYLGVLIFMERTAV